MRVQGMKEWGWVWVEGLKSEISLMGVIAREFDGKNIEPVIYTCTYIYG